MVAKSARRDRSLVRKTTGAAGYLAALGHAVRWHRVKVRLSQEQLAFDVELDRTYISGIERGVRNPTVATLLRLTHCARCAAQHAAEDGGEDREVAGSPRRRRARMLAWPGSTTR